MQARKHCQISGSLSGYGLHGPRLHGIQPAGGPWVQEPMTRVRRKRELPSHSSLTPRTMRAAEVRFSTPNFLRIALTCTVTVR